MKIALASVISASPLLPPTRNKMRNTSVVLRKLSLNAAKNWHQNSGAKRLDNIRGGGMPADYCRVPLRAGGGGVKKLAAFWPPKESRYRYAESLTVTKIPDRLCFLVGLQNHGP